MKVKLRLKDKSKIAWDPDTDITWEGDKIIESEITPFVAKALAKKVLEEVKKDDNSKEKIKEESEKNDT